MFSLGDRCWHLFTPDDIRECAGEGDILHVDADEAARVRLVERVLMTLEREFVSPEPKGRVLLPLQTWRGLCADLGRAPSADEIGDTRKEVWSNFPRADLP